MTYELHPLCTLFPRVEGAEFEALCADIKANGLRTPITLHGGMILDGGNRYRACLASGVDPSFVEFSGDSIVAFVLSANLHRRHLSPGQQAAIVASAQDWALAQTHGGKRRGDQAATLPLKTVKDRAAESGASERTQRMADKVSREAPELAVKVAHGEISLPKAVEQIAPKKAPQEVPDFSDEPDADEPSDELEELRAEYEDVVAANQRLTALVSGKDETDALIKNLQTELKQCKDTLRTVDTQRDELMRENAQLKREVKNLRRKLDKKGDA